MEQKQDQFDAGPNKPDPESYRQLLQEVFNIPDCRNRIGSALWERIKRRLQTS